jgi:glycosyltransferase involved in cell wall biosynthesis
MKNLTAVIPVRNMAGKLSELELAITAALSVGFRVIVVHDGAEDQTGLDLQKIYTRQNYEGLELLTGVYNSPGGARNAGVKKVTTDWLTFWDADDSPIVENLSKLYRIVETSNADVGIGGYADTNSLNPSESKLYRNEHIDLNAIALSPGIWRMIFRTELIINSPFKNLLLAEDQILLSDIRVTQRKIVYSNEVVYNYNSGNPNSLTGKNRKIEDLIQASSYLLKNIKIETTSSQKEFDWVLLAKQSLTIFKYGNIKNRIFASQKLFQFLFIAPRKARQTIIRLIIGKVL